MLLRKHPDGPRLIEFAKDQIDKRDKKAELLRQEAREAAEKTDRLGERNIAEGGPDLVGSRIRRRECDHPHKLRPLLGSGPQSAADVGLPEVRV